MMKREWRMEVFTASHASHPPEFSELSFSYNITSLLCPTSEQPVIANLRATVCPTCPSSCHTQSCNAEPFIAVASAGHHHIVYSISASVA